MDLRFLEEFKKISGKANPWTMLRLIMLTSSDDQQDMTNLFNIPSLKIPDQTISIQHFAGDWIYSHLRIVSSKVQLK